MKSKALNRTQLAARYRVSLPTVDNWLRRGLPHSRRNGRYRFDLREVATWRARALAENSQRRNHRGHAIPDAAAEWLTGLMMGYAQPFWWNIDRAEGPERDQMAKHIVTVDEYRAHYDLDGDEIMFRVLYGLPVLPAAPDDPEQHMRISLPHAKVWHFLFAGCIETLGGDGNAPRIAMEAERLRGYPPRESDDAGEDESAETAAP